MAPTRESENRRALQTTDDTKKVLEQYQQRITQVETEVTIVKVQHTNLQVAFDKVVSLIESITKQINYDEQAAAAIRERTDQHADQIKHLQEKEVDTSKILEVHQLQLQKHENNFSLGRWLVVTVGGLAVGSFFSHFFGK